MTPNKRGIKTGLNLFLEAYGQYLPGGPGGPALPGFPANPGRPWVPGFPGFPVVPYIQQFPFQICVSLFDANVLVL